MVERPLVRSIARVVILVAVGALGIWALTLLELPRWQTQLGDAVIALIQIALLLADPTTRGWVRKVSVDQWKAIDDETDREPGQAGRASWQVAIILVTVAVSLTLQEYIGDRGYFERVFPPHGRDAYWELKGFAWWSGWRVLGYVVIPMIVLAIMPGERIRNYHVSPRGFFKHLWIYVLLFACVLPAVIGASTTATFRHTYPFYRMANRSGFDLWTWEGLYAAQFVSLEFFFRGFILNGLRRALGSNAIFVMIVPYCMIHYGKPMPETLGAIGAGLILGTLAMRTKSIWGGVLIHIGVAITMDILALRGCPTLGSGHFCGE
jgi:membrane protease YdiL (CAAX protease family)